MTWTCKFSLCVAMGLALLLGLSVSASAQSISGSVKGPRGPIVGATVRLLELDRAQETGAGGSFAFTRVPRGKYNVFVSVVGYASASSAVEVTGDSASADFTLKESAIPMKEIVVSATPFARTPDEVYQSAERKDRTDFQTGAGMNYSEKIEDLPGVSVRGNGSAPNRPVLRGLSDNRVLVLENGLRDGDIATYDPAHATPIEAIGVSEVEVVRGPATILYGPSTIGGLVNLFTNSTPDVASRRWTGTVNLEGNSGSNEYAGYFNSVYSQGNSAFRISAGGTHSEDIRIPSGTYTDPATGAEFQLDRMPQTFNQSSEEGAGYSYQGDFGSIGLSGKHYQMNYGIAGVPPNEDWMDVPPTTSRIAQKRYVFELHSLLNAGGSAQKQWKLDAAYNDYNHSEFPTAQDSTGVSDPQANHFYKRELNATLQFQHQQATGFSGTVGAWTDLQDLIIDGDQPLGPNSMTTGFAGYVFEEYAASGKTRLQGGLRFDYNKIQTRPAPNSTDSVFLVSDESRQNNAFTASLGAMRKFTPQLTGTVSVARSFRAPTVQELFADGLDAPSGSYTIGTSTLGSETGIGIDASLKGTYSKFTFEVAPYANIVKNYIYGFLTGDTLLDFPVRKFAATDARLMGFEASLDVAAAACFAIRASADYVNAEDTQQNVPLPFTPPLRGLLRGTYQDDRYTASAEVRMAARQSRLGDGDTPTDGYAVVNAGVGIRLSQQGASHVISLHCDNVFDTVYRDHLSVIKDFLPQPGRTFRLNYELQY